MVKKGKKKTKNSTEVEEELIKEPETPVKIGEAKFKPGIGPTHLTKYERARIIGARALQISMSAPILLDEVLDIRDPIQIAELELEQGLLPITIRRKLPDGQFEDIPLKYLLTNS